MGKRVEEAKRRRKHRIMATGTFDLIHPGHIFYLYKSKELGKELHVIVARDSNINEGAVIPENQRKEVVESIKPVDKAYLGHKEDKMKSVKKISPDIITIGPDQDWDVDVVQDKIHSFNEEIDVIKIEDYKDCELCSTSEIITKIKKN